MPVGECRRALVRLAVRPICDAAQRTAVRLGFSRNGGHRVPIGPLCPVGSQCGHANISTEWRTRLAARRIAWVSASGKHIGGGAAQVLAQLDKAELYASAVAAARCSTFGYSFAVLPPTPSARLALLLLPRRLLRASASMRVSARRVLRTIPAISLGRRSVWRCVQLHASAFNDDKDHFQADPATADDHRHDPLHGSARLPRVRAAWHATWHARPCGTTSRVARCIAARHVAFVACHVACLQRMREPPLACRAFPLKDAHGRACTVPRIA